MSIYFVFRDVGEKSIEKVGKLHELLFTVNAIDLMNISFYYDAFLHLIINFSCIYRQCIRCCTT